MTDSEVLREAAFIGSSRPLRSRCRAGVCSPHGPALQPMSCGTPPVSHACGHRESRPDALGEEAPSLRSISPRPCPPPLPRAEMGLGESGCPMGLTSPCAKPHPRSSPRRGEKVDAKRIVQPPRVIRSGAVMRGLLWRTGRPLGPWWASQLRAGPSRASASKRYRRVNHPSAFSDRGRKIRATRHHPVRMMSARRSKLIVGQNVMGWNGARFLHRRLVAPVA